MHVGREEMQTKMGGIIEGLKQTKEKKKEKNICDDESPFYVFLY